MIIENFDDFYDHYQGFSAYVAFCITEDYELSKDISQEVFLALFKVKEKLDYSRPDKLKALVMKATSNKCMDYYRKASSRQESYTIDDEENAYEPVDEKSNPEARILRMEEEKYQKLVLYRLYLIRRLPFGSFFFISPSSFRICLHYIVLPYCLQQKRSLILL